jgi:lipoate-protein ligase B
MSGLWTDLGRMDYEPCSELQRELLESVASGAVPSTLLFVEHPPVLTLGANFHPDNLRLPKEQYERLGITVHPTERGGDVTYHGPGQLVAYPIFSLGRVERDLHKWLRSLEEWVIRALDEFGLNGDRFPPNTGVWVGNRKICAIGIKVRKWVSMHGIALNCSNDLAPFELIVPCGIKEYGVTSLSKELGRPVPPEDARPAVIRAFEKVFGLPLVEESRVALLERLSVRR